jgi:hypothetical protein
MASGHDTGQCEMEVPAFHQFVQANTTIFSQADVHVGTRALELRQETSQDALHDLRGGPDPKDSGHPANQASGAFDEGCRVSEHVTTLSEQILTFRGELDAAANAVQETHAKLRFQIADLPRKRRLADVAERNTLWTRMDDGSQPGHTEIHRQEDREIGPGDVLTLQPDSIHSVINETASVTVSFHVYGKHVNHTERSQFDPEQHTEKGFIIKIA